MKKKIILLLLILITLFSMCILYEHIYRTKITETKLYQNIINILSSKYGSFKYIDIPYYCPSLNNSFVLDDEDTIFIPGYTSCLYSFSKDEFTKVETPYLDEKIQDYEIGRKYPLFFLNKDEIYIENGEIYNFKTKEVKKLDVKLKKRRDEAHNTTYADKIHEFKVGENKILRIMDIYKESKYEVCNTDSLKCEIKGYMNYDLYFRVNIIQVSKNEYLLDSVDDFEIYNSENDIISPVYFQTRPKGFLKKYENNYYANYALKARKAKNHLFTKYKNFLSLYEYKNNEFNLIKEVPLRKIETSSASISYIGKNQFLICGGYYGEYDIKLYSDKTYILDLDKEKIIPFTKLPVCTSNVIQFEKNKYGFIAEYGSNKDRKLMILER